MSSYEFGDMLMKNTPAWMLQIILPVGFGLMAYRHLVLAVKRPFNHSSDLENTGTGKGEPAQ